MADHSKIEWTDATWNPITGCSVVSPGCTNCYAMKLAGTRLKHHPSRAGLTRDTKARGGEADGRAGKKKNPVWTGEVRFNEQWLDQPLRWTKPRRIFVCAHGDLFAEGVTDDMLDRIFAVMALAPQHTFQVLTKRPDRMRDYVWQRAGDWATKWGSAASTAKLETFTERPDDHGRLLMRAYGPFPLPNVWLGVSCEDQTRADERVPILLDTPAAIRWVSAEPLLGPIDFTSIDTGSGWVDSLQSYIRYPTTNPGSFRNEPIDWPRLDWIVAGGESGRGARPMHPDWVRAIRDACAAADVPFLFKQWGAWAPSSLGVEIARASSEERRWNGESWNGLMSDAQTSEPDTMNHVGKKRAGRLLDGVTHDDFPAVAA